MPLILIRHGQSQWNLENRFTGWVDVDLTDQGRSEATRAGQQLKTSGMAPDVVFTSPLKRARETCALILTALQSRITPQESPEMIERYYGGLTGLNKQETADLYGEQQVHIWRRSYDQCPPAVDNQHEHHPQNNPMFADFPFSLPNTESLKDVVARVDPFYRNVIKPLLNDNQTVLIVAHGNSIRALIKIMAKLTEAQIESVEIPTGRPVMLTQTQDGAWSWQVFE